jgi:cytochrome P450
MRLWPVAAIGTSRLVGADIPYGDKIIPKGAIASVGFFAMFRSGIKDPHSFIPDRCVLCGLYPTS